MPFRSFPAPLAAQPADPAQLIGTMALVAVAVFIVMFLQVVALAKFYRKASPGFALVRTGHGGLRVAAGSGVFVIPLLHCCELMSLAPLRIDLCGSQLDCEAARSWQLPSIFQVAVGTEPGLLQLAASRLHCSQRAEQNILLAKDIILDEYERLLAQASETASHDSPANRFLDGVEQSLNQVGLTIIACHCH